MLTCLRIRDLAIVDCLDIEIGPGLNVITGETGAGKSILVDALELLLGSKGRSELVRTGADHAEVEALFEVGDDPSLARQLAGLGLEPASELIIRRRLLANGRTRAFINGQLATAQQLGSLSQDLLDISSQHEHHMLSNAATHLTYLDESAGLGPLCNEVAEKHRRAKSAFDQVEAFHAQLRDRCEREDLLRFQVGEIEAVSPQQGEESELQEQLGRLRHADALLQATSEASEALYEGDASVSELLSRIAERIGHATTLDPSLSALHDQLEGARAQLEDAGRELGAYARGVRADPERLMAIEERAHQLTRLKRKYGGTLEAVLSHLAKSREELAHLGDGEGFREQLAQTAEALLAEAGEAAEELSRRRKEAASRLANAVGHELTSLGMSGARIEVELSLLEKRAGELWFRGARLSPAGRDRVEFLIGTNRGEPARPLSKVASGGELSRIMLAIKRVLSGLGPAGLYVFDEVDTGVGGAIAEVIGRKVQSVARQRQVVCITHLAQIAMFADRHFKVEKTTDGERTVSAVRRLTKREREQELARMLGGLKITAKTRAVAAEMLREARATAA